MTGVHKAPPKRLRAVCLRLARWTHLTGVVLAVHWLAHTGWYLFEHVVAHVPLVPSSKQVTSAAANVPLIVSLPLGIGGLVLLDVVVERSSTRKRD